MPASNADPQGKSRVSVDAGGRILLPKKVMGHFSHDNARLRQIRLRAVLPGCLLTRDRARRLMGSRPNYLFTEGHL